VTPSAISVNADKGYTNYDDHSNASEDDITADIEEEWEKDVGAQKRAYEAEQVADKIERERRRLVGEPMFSLWSLRT
jgi:hypothetical protein